MTKKTYIDGLGREIIEGDLATDKETNRDQCIAYDTVSTMMQLQNTARIHKERQDRHRTSGEYRAVYRISTLTKILIGIGYCSLAFAIIGRYLLIVFDLTRPSWMRGVGALVGMVALLIQAGLNLLD